MFVPAAFHPQDQAWLIEMIRSFPLATLVSAGPDGLFATHLPVLLGEDAGIGGPHDGDLLGTPILGHMNRQNPHYRAVLSTPQALLVFNGPNGYVSPAVYERTPVAPTWNFVSVHVRGTTRPITDEAETRHVVRSTASIFEARFGKGWDMGPSLDYFDRILPGVGAFRMTVTAVDGMFKLSQDQPPELRAKVIRAFAEDDRGMHRELAELMTRFAPTPEPRAETGRVS